MSRPSADRRTSAAPTVRVFAISARADVGGGPEHMLQLFSTLGDQVEVVIACPRQDPYWDRFSALTNLVELIEIPVRRFETSVLRRLARDVRRTGAALIHSHGKGAGAYGRPLSVLTRVPCVHTFHGLHTAEYNPLSARAYVGLERCMSWATRFTICVSPGERDAILAAGICPVDKLRLIPNGVRLPHVAAHLSDVDEAIAKPLGVVAVTRYNQQKNAGLAIDIMRWLQQHEPGAVHLTMVGDGDGYQAATERVRAAGLADSVDLVGAVAALRPYLRNADVFLSTSRWEGLPLSLLEAMSEGRTVVATDVVGNRDAVVDGATGILFPSDDAEAGARALLRLRRAELRTELGAASRRRVAAHYTVDEMARSTLTIYRAAIAQ